MISDRLKLLRNKLNMNQKEFAKLIDISYSSYNNYEIGRRNLSIELALSIKKSSKCRIEWLLEGEGEMFIEEEAEAPETIDKTFGETVEIAFIGGVSCGEPLEIPNLQDETVPVPSYFIKGNPKNYHVGIANGNSMEPEIKHGDWLLLKQCKDWEQANGKVVAVIIGGEVTLKKLEKHDKAKILILKPFNSDYRNIIITEETEEDIKLEGILQMQIRKY